MSNPYIGEIRIFAGFFAPVDWHFCDGTMLSIAENTVLFQVIGTNYGGNGQSTFALPDLRSRVPMHQGASNVIGEFGGTENVTLTLAQLPAHNHSLSFSNSGQVRAPSNATMPAYATSGQAGAINVYGPAPTNTTLNPNTLKYDGQGLPHSNIQPYLALNFIIAMSGIYPSQ